MPPSLNQGSADVLESKVPAFSASDARQMAGNVFGIQAADRLLDALNRALRAG